MQDPKKVRVSLAILFALVFFYLFESFRLYPIESIGFNFPLLLRIAVLWAGVVVLNMLFYVVCVKDQGWQGFWKELFTVFYSVIMLFYLLEGFFIFYPKTHSAGNTALSNISWASYYNSSKNEYDFRDHPVGNLEGKKVIYAIGDSFAGGWGIKNIDQRYSNILEKKLGPDYRVLNMGVPGFGTRQEIYVLNKFLNVYDVKKPDLVIWQYYVNDILGLGAPPAEVFDGYRHRSPLVKYVVQNSFFLNFLYWLFPQKFDMDYDQYLETYFLNHEEKLRLHLSDIAFLTRMCKDKKIPLIVIGFPSLSDMDKTGPFIFFLEQFFAQEHVDFINICRLVKDIPFKERIVAINDPHPSLRVHRLVADELFLRIKTMDLYKK